MVFTSLESLYQDIRRRLIIEDSTTRDQIYRDLDSFGLQPRNYRHALELWRSLMLDILMAIQPYYNMLKNNRNANDQNYRRFQRRYEFDESEPREERKDIHQTETEEISRIVGQITPHVFSALFTPPPPPPSQTVPLAGERLPNGSATGDFNFMHMLDEALRQMPQANNNSK